MKWSTTILALYLLGLTLWPCADEFLPIVGQKQGCHVACISTSLPQPGQSHEHHDQCTPFCTCACCTSSIIEIPHFSYSITPSIEVVPIAVATYFYFPLHWAEPLSAIWQPPKLRV